MRPGPAAVPFPEPPAAAGPPLNLLEIDVTEYQVLYFTPDRQPGAVNRPSWRTALATARTLGGQVWERKPGGDWQRAWPC